ncbi:MAG: type I DNA topoisomerase [Candidatus Nanopelagicales bacterium]|nr:type I DNA topoisomerase [Candidatus Nanopelagicales bacterium]
MPARTATPRRLVIVESPAKARTIQGYLGDGFVVEASVGHIRDLPDSAATVPASIKGKPWARLGIDVEDDFKPYYVVSPSKRAKVAELKKALAGADELWLATDEDREGEAIAWHLHEVLNPKVPVRRMVFHEITPEAIQQAAANTRDLDLDLVDAQEARRIVDRLFGFEVSPVLWKKVMAGLSAGRVQSVATRLVVDRERARIAFRAAGYWDATGTFTAAGGEFPAKLVSVEGTRVAGGGDFGDDGQLKPAAAKAGVVRLDEAAALGLVGALEGATWTVRSVTEKPTTRRPSAPFMTSTLQQEASRKLRWGAQRTMRAAQGLYENGHITYMRTDSTSLSSSALAAARRAASELYGPEYVHDSPRTYDRKVKNAQEAHEAIRPAGDAFKRPAELAGRVGPDEFALYDLIWKRTLASQMADARLATTTVRLGATASDGRDVEFGASGTVTLFAGFLAAYEEWSDDVRDREASGAAGEGGGGRAADRRLPAVRTGDALACRELRAEGHTTTPPARYTEASLVKDLEERGIGRPSTYAATIATIVDREYVRKQGSALVPTFLGFNVTRVMEQHFAPLVDYGFTARMEEVLDRVANASTDRLAALHGFFTGDPERDFPGLSALLAGLPDIDARALASFPIGPDGITEAPVRGEPGEVVLRVGKYGPYVERTTAAGESEKGNVPADLAPDELTLELAEALLAAPSGDRLLGVDPATGLSIAAKSGRFGPYVTELPAEDAAKSWKPRRGSLLEGMTVDSVTLEEALRILSLPRTVGTDPEGRVVQAAKGRYGPYVVRTVDDKPDYRNLASDEAIFTVTLDEALAIFAEPKARRGQARAAAAPLRELGADPATGAPITVREGRFGPYVSDGTTNATLRRADDPATVSLERAAELLAEKRAAGPSKRPTRKAAAKKAPAKKAPAKKAPAKR